VNVIDDDENDMVSDEIAVASFDATRRYLGAVLAAQGAYKSEPDIPDDPLELSYYMGMIATTAARRSLQTLLEYDTVIERLQAGIALLEEELSRMDPVFMRAGPGKSRALFSSN
jgi:hypothetical protein